MESMVIDRKILPEHILSYIHSEKIKLVEENGTIILSPIPDKYVIEAPNKKHKTFSALKLKTIGFKFDREIANER